MALHDVSAKAAVGLHGQLKIDERAFVNAGERSTLPGLGGKIGAERSGLDVERGEADTAYGDAIAGLEFFGRVLGRHGDAPILAALLDTSDPSNFFYDAGEHMTSRNKLNIINPLHEFTDGLNHEGQEGSRRTSFILSSFVILRVLRGSRFFVSTHSP